MSFSDLNNDVKSIIAKHLTNDYKISPIVMSRHYDLQQLGELVFDDDFHKVKKLDDDIDDVLVLHAIH